MAPLLVRAAHPQPAADHHPGSYYFTDVSTSSPHDDDIGTLYESGITHGVTATTYDPEGEVTRQQMASFLVRAANLHPAADHHPGSYYFTDVSSTSPHDDDVGTLSESSVTKGCDANDPALYCPAADVLRDQMAAFLARAFLGY